MRISKFFSFIFGILGTALMILAVILCLSSLDKGAFMAEVPKEATACTENLMRALAEGDYVAAEALLYGEARIGDPREAAREEGKMIWHAYCDSFTYAFSGACYGGEKGIRRDVTITTLDIPSVTGSLNELARALLEKKEADAREVDNLNLVYNEDGSIRDTVLEAVMTTALEQALQEANTLTTTLTLELVSEDGGWQVLPSEQLLKAVGGGL